MTSGGVLFMHDNPAGKYVLLLGLFGVLLTMYSWWTEVVRKSRCSTASGNGRAAEVDGIGV